MKKRVVFIPSTSTTQLCTTRSQQKYTMATIDNVREAITVGATAVKNKEGLTRHRSFDGERGLAGIYLETPSNKYCLKFQKSLFGTFSWVEDGTRHKQVAVSFRSDQLFDCREAGYTPMIILSDGKMYTFPAADWIKWCNEHASDGVNVIYKSENREDPTDNWTYYNVPISFMERY